jgi:hypothetical protein
LLIDKSRKQMKRPSHMMSQMRGHVFCIAYVKSPTLLKPLQKLNKKAHLSMSFFCCTVQQEYFQHLEGYLRLIEPIIQDLKVKGFIK